MQEIKHDVNPEIGLGQLRSDANYSEQTKGIEYGVNPGKVDTDYIKWFLIISAILSILGGVLTGIANNI